MVVLSLRKSLEIFLSAFPGELIPEQFRRKKQKSRLRRPFKIKNGRKLVSSHGKPPCALSHCLAYYGS